MVGTLTVQTIQGPTSGANANKVIIPSGQTLDASAGFVPPAGSVIQVARNLGTGGNGTTGTTWVNLGVSVTITPQYTDSILVVQFFATAYTSLSAGYFSIARDGTRIGNGTDGSLSQMFPAGGGSIYQPSALSTYVTSGSTASTTFAVAVKSTSASGGCYFPAGAVDQWTAYAMEIKQ